MKSNYLAAALLGATLLTGAAFAQNATTDRSNINTAVQRWPVAGFQGDWH
jgi:hypothetical protein